MNTMLSGSKRAVTLAHFDGFSDPAELVRADEYIGQNTVLSVVRTNQATYELRLHDEVTKGGLVVGAGLNIAQLEGRLAALEADAPDDFIAFSNLVGTDLQMITNTGSIITADVTALFDNVNAVPGVYALNGAVTNVPLTNGANIELDTSALATDTELANAIAALPDEEFVNNIVVSAAGVATFLTNLGNTAGTLDVQSIAENVDTYLKQPTLTGTVVSFPMENGASYTLDLASLNETLTNNGDGTLTWNDGEGNTITFATDTDDQRITSDGSIVSTPTTQPDGQIDYSLATNSQIIPATDPTGGGGSSVQDALDNIYAEVTDNSIQSVALTRRTTAGQTHLLDWDDKDGNTDTIHDASISTDDGNTIIRGTDDGLFAKNELVLVQEDIYTGVKFGWMASTLFTDHGTGKYLVTVTNANIEYLNTSPDPYMRFSGQATNVGVGLSGVSTVQVDTTLDQVNFESATETRCIPRTTGATYTIDDQSPYTMEAWVDWDGSSIHVRGTAIYQWTNGATKPAKVSFYGSRVDANLTGVSFQHIDCRFNGATVRVYKLS